MDLLSLMHQRVNDQHSELRRSRFLCLAYLSGAATLSVVAAFAASCISADGDEAVATQRSEQGSSSSLAAAVGVCGFAVAALGTFLCMVRAANALMTDRSISLLPVYSGSRLTGSCVMLPRNEQLSEKTRKLLVNGFYLSVVAAGCLGVTGAPQILYGFFYGLQWLLYLAYLFLLSRTVNTTR